MNSISAIAIVRHPLESSVRDEGSSLIPICADRWQLAKLRWRATAADGREFGFELDHPLHHGDLVGQNDHGNYVIQQDTEPVLTVPLSDPASAARLAWSVGNLHQPLQVTDSELVLPDDPAVRTLLSYLHIGFQAVTRVFEPSGSPISHHHAH